MSNYVKFSRLLYICDYKYDYVIEFEVNGEMKLWYNSEKYRGFIKNEFENDVHIELSDRCILQEQTNLPYLFCSSPITHFDIDLPNVKITNSMFLDCKDLIYFKSKMPNVKHTKHMFLGCSEEFFQKHPHLRDL